MSGLHSVFFLFSDRKTDFSLENGSPPEVLGTQCVFFLQLSTSPLDIYDEGGGTPLGPFISGAICDSIFENEYEGWNENMLRNN
jgi:hypothetical protein